MNKITNNTLRWQSYINRLFFLFLLLCTIFEVCAANSKPFPFSYGNQYKSFKNILLPHDANQVNTIFQDNSGLIWVGTKNGLFSYDGYRIQDYVLEADSETKDIFSIVQIDSVRLCLGTGRGILFFNLFTEQYEPVNAQLKKIRTVRSLALFDKKLWIGSRDKDLYCYDFEKDSLMSVPLTASDEQTIIYSLVPTEAKLYIGSYGGLSFYNPIKKKRERLPLPEQYENEMVNSLLWDEGRNCLWVGTEGALFQYIPDTRQINKIPSFPANSFKTLTLDGKKDLVVGTDNGLYIYGVESHKLEHIVHDSRNKQSLCNNIVWCAFTDKAKNVWLGTDRGSSLAVYHPTFHFIHISEITDNGIGNQFTTILKDSKENYWLGGINGLILMNKVSGAEEGQYKINWFRSGDNGHALPHNRIRCIYEDRDKDIWIATDGGIARYDVNTGRFVHYAILNATRLKNANWAYDIYEDEKGRLWIATYLGGLFVVNKNKLTAGDNTIPYLAEKNYSDANGSSPSLSNIVYKIEVDKNGFVWVNTQEGLVRIDIRNNHIEKKDIYLDKMIYDGNDYIWYSTERIIYRLHIFSGYVEKVCTLPEGSHVYSFTVEEKKLWFSYTEGISVLNRETLQKENISIPNYYYLSCFLDDSHQLLLWGGEDGIACLSTMLAQNTVSSEPPVTITSIWNSKGRLMPGLDYEGKSVKYRNEVELHYSTSNLTLEFSSFTYSPETDRAFYYCLDGANNVWTKLEVAQNRIFLPNLEPGRYTIKVRNGNDTSTASSVTNFKITILPPWYRTLYAYTIYILIFLCIAWLILWRIQLRMKRRYERMEKEKTLELSNLKMDFFMNISHELKTPLSLIIAPLSKLISETKNQESKQKLELIHQNSLRLNTLIQQVLNFKQMEYNSENVLIRSHIELCAFLKNIVESFSPVFAEKKIFKSFASNQKEIWMNLDVLKIESIFVNIISNAVKYMPESGGEIHVAIRQEGDRNTIVVSDNGIGIKKEDLSYIFIRFYQSKTGRKHTNGSGIGLYIVKKFVELHGGRIEVHSQGEGYGTTVKVEFPLSDENRVPIQEHSDIQEGIVEDNSFPVLLIIDDNQEMVSFLIETFSKTYRCLKAFNGKEGLSVVRENTVDLIIVDEMMPEMGGLEFCRVLRRNQPTASIPAIMLTAKDDLETEKNSIKAGVDIFMPKPFDIDKLSLRLVQLQERRNSLEQRIRIENISKPVVEESFQSNDEILLAKVVSVIEENMENTEFNVTMLSDLMDIDGKQLYRKLKQLTGSSPVDYIRQIRMKKAAVLLAQKKFSVSEVMYMVGYTNASYFSRCFVAEFNMTPKQYMLLDTH